jgi:hypothetical protein
MTVVSTPPKEWPEKWVIYLIGICCLVAVLWLGAGRPKKPSVPPQFKVRNYFNPSLPPDHVIGVDQPGPNRVGRPRSKSSLPEAPSSSSAIDLEAGLGTLYSVIYSVSNFAMTEFCAWVAGLICSWVVRAL